MQIRCQYSISHDFCQGSIAKTVRNQHKETNAMKENSAETQKQNRKVAICQNWRIAHILCKVSAFARQNNEVKTLDISEVL